MPKQGQHPHDGNDENVSKSHNNPSKSEEIVTSSYKKPETYKKQAALHQDPSKTAQHAKVHDIGDTRDTARLLIRANVVRLSQVFASCLVGLRRSLVSHKAESELLGQEPHKRSGSNSDQSESSWGR